MSDRLSDFATYAERRRSSGNLGLGLSLLVIGLAGGALTALLLAPKTGKQMRKTLRRKYEDVRDIVEDWGAPAGEWMGKSSQWGGKARSSVLPLVKPFRR
jgi:gas vesicle protein